MRQLRSELQAAQETQQELSTAEAPLFLSPGFGGLRVRSVTIDEFVLDNPNGLSIRSLRLRRL